MTILCLDHATLYSLGDSVAVHNNKRKGKRLEDLLSWAASARLKCRCLLGCIITTQKQAGSTMVLTTRGNVHRHCPFTIWVYSVRFILIIVELCLDIFDSTKINMDTSRTSPTDEGNNSCKNKFKSSFKVLFWLDRTISIRTVVYFTMWLFQECMQCISVIFFGG